MLCSSGERGGGSRAAPGTLVAIPRSGLILNRFLREVLFRGLAARGGPDNSRGCLWCVLDPPCSWPAHQPTFPGNAVRQRCQ